MKIGIMTFSESTINNNYGRVLQLFALQWYLRNLGYDAYAIKYERVPKKNPLYLRLLHALNPKVLIRYCLRNIRKSLVEKEKESFPRHFEEFFTKYIKTSAIRYVDLSELKENPPEADVYLAGSDQIWNGEHLAYDKKKIHVFFLDFGKDDTPRISYAASWGKSVFPDKYIKEVQPLLKRFQAVSVREKSGIDLCRQAGFEGAKWVCDPTLLLTADEYRKIYNENQIRKRNKKYLLLYILGDKIDTNMQVVYEFTKSKELEIVLVYDGFIRVKGVDTVFATIPEWLYLIDNAEYVITNSFHGTAVSTIFGKRYGVIHSQGLCAEREIRMNFLFERCGISPRWLNKGEGLSILDESYTADISSFRQESIKFLNEVLGSVHKE